MDRHLALKANKLVEHCLRASENDMIVSLRIHLQEWPLKPIALLKPRKERI
ncbi:hypothetical protein SPHINGOT1_310021 [Sphingomonas sp. T1]|nr:hypothetical protein SPHINGOT1_310021 [Sphingomonas sp. T1]